MKVTISIDEQSLGNEMKCASDFLRALANERNQANGFPTFGETPKEVPTGKAVILESKKAPTEVVEEEITHEEKVAALANKVVEATQVKEEEEEEEEEETPEAPGKGLTYHMVDTVCAMSEEEMKAVPTQVLYDILTRRFNVDPAERPGKNTNAKLRGLLLSAINAEAKEEETVAEEENAPQAQAIEPQEAEEVPEEAEESTEEVETEVAEEPKIEEAPKVEVKAPVKNTRNGKRR